MLENGADVRFIQAMLGHAGLNTTEIYTQVSVKKLKEVHTKTHPGAALKARAKKAGGGDESTEETLMADFEAESEEES